MYRKIFIDMSYAMTLTFDVAVFAVRLIVDKMPLCENQKRSPRQVLKPCRVATHLNLQKYWDLPKPLQEGNRLKPIGSMSAYSSKSHTCAHIQHGQCYASRYGLNTAQIPLEGNNQPGSSSSFSMLVQPLHCEEELVKTRM